MATVHCLNQQSVRINGQEWKKKTRQVLNAFQLKLLSTALHSGGSWHNKDEEVNLLVNTSSNPSGRSVWQIRHVGSKVYWVWQLPWDVFSPSIIQYKPFDNVPKPPASGNHHDRANHGLRRIEYNADLFMTAVVQMAVQYSKSHSKVIVDDMSL